MIDTLALIPAFSPEEKENRSPAFLECRGAEMAGASSGKRKTDEDCSLSLGREFPETIRALNPSTNGKHPTSTNQHRTPKGARIRAFFGCSALDVGCWMFLEVYREGRVSGH
jgi:hypothetical protein